MSQLIFEAVQEVFVPASGLDDVKRIQDLNGPTGKTILRRRAMALANHGSLPWHQLPDGCELVSRASRAYREYRLWKEFERGQAEQSAKIAAGDSAGDSCRGGCCACPCG